LIANHTGEQVSDGLNTPQNLHFPGRASCAAQCEGLKRACIWTADVGVAAVSTCLGLAASFDD